MEKSNIMNRIFLATVLFLFTATAFAQQDSIQQPKEEQVEKAKVELTEIQQLQADRDSAKSILRVKTSANTRNNNRYEKLQNDKNKYKTQLSTAKKSKKQEKIEAAQGKIEENKQQIKDLDAQLKEEAKELTQLEKDLKNAEKTLKTAKEKAAKEKAKSKK